jgi:hypothetical protein
MLGKQMDAIFAWVDAPRYRDVYERATQGRLPGSFKNFFADPQYLTWRVFDPDRSSSSKTTDDGWKSRMLCVQGS